MTKKAYIGVNGIAQQIKKGYIGVDNTAKQIKKAYVGVGGIARPCWSSELLSYIGTVASLPSYSVRCLCSFNDNALFFIGYNLVVYNDNLVQSTIELSFSPTAVAPNSQYVICGTQTTSTYSTSVFALNSSFVHSSLNDMQYITSNFSATTFKAKDMVVFYGGVFYNKKSSVSGWSQRCYGYSSELVSRYGNSCNDTWKPAGASVGEYAFFGGGAYESNYVTDDPSTPISDVVYISEYLQCRKTLGLNIAAKDLSSFSLKDYACFLGGYGPSSYNNKANAITSALTYVAIESISYLYPDTMSSCEFNGYGFLSGQAPKKQNPPLEVYAPNLVHSVYETIMGNYEKNAMAHTKRYLLVGGGGYFSSNTTTMHCFAM